MKSQLTQIIKYWKYVSPIVKYPKNQKEFTQLTARLDELLDVVGNDEKHPLMGLVDVMSHLIEHYEQEHILAPKTKGIDALKFLMQQHALHQSDLSEIGSQGVISEILNNKRRLNLRQIKLLSKRFSVDPSTFMD